MFAVPWAVLLLAALAVGLLIVQTFRIHQVSTLTEKIIGLLCLVIVFLSLYVVSVWQTQYPTRHQETQEEHSHTM